MMRWRYVGLGLLIATVAFADQPIGTLTVEQGTVQIERKERGTITARKRKRIRVGDQIICAQNASATVVFDATRKIWRLQPESRVEVHAEGFKTLAGKAPVQVGEIPQPKGANLPPPRSAGVSIRGDLLELMPVGASRQAPLTVRWHAPLWAKQARLEVIDGADRTKWSKDALDPRAGQAEIPASALDGARWVRIRIMVNGDGRVSSAESWARLLSQAEIRQLQAEEEAFSSLKAHAPTTCQLAQAELLASYGLLSEAKSVLDALYPGMAERKEPDLSAGEYWWQLGRLYERAGFLEEAYKAYAQAWWHGERNPDLKKALERLGEQ